MQVLVLDASSAEAIACLAAEHFYSDQPELAIRYYRRLLQVCGCVLTSRLHVVWRMVGCIRGMATPCSTNEKPAVMSVPQLCTVRCGC
jgi:hypothetical protein